MPLIITGVEVACFLLVVTDLSFPIIVGTNILQANSATMSLGDAVMLRLNAGVCDVCREQLTELSLEFWCTPSAVCTTDFFTIPSRTAPLVQLRVPSEIYQSPSVAVVPRGSAILKFGCATLSSMFAPVDGVCHVAIVNPLCSSVVIKPETVIAAVNSVVPS